MCSKGPSYVLVENLENYFSITHSFMLECAIIILEIQLLKHFPEVFEQQNDFILYTWKNVKEHLKP